MYRSMGHFVRMRGGCVERKSCFARMNLRVQVYGTHIGIVCRDGSRKRPGEPKCIAGQRVEAKLKRYTV